jgi:hypothetical protein
MQRLKEEEEEEMGREGMAMEDVVQDDKSSDEDPSKKSCPSQDQNLWWAGDEMSIEVARVVSGTAMHNYRNSIWISYTMSYNMHHFSTRPKSSVPCFECSLDIYVMQIQINRKTQVAREEQSP